MSDGTPEMTEETFGQGGAPADDWQNPEGDGWTPQPVYYAPPASPATPVAPADERAREVLATVFDDEDMPCTAQAIRDGKGLRFNSIDIPLKAIARALATPIPASPEPSPAISAAAQRLAARMGMEFVPHEPAIPAGMVAYGPQHPDYPNAPADWRGGEVLLHDGRRGVPLTAMSLAWRDGSVIAYTPKVAPIPASSPAQGEAGDEETYQIGVRDGYEEAVQDIDLMTGGDGEYYASTIPGRGCPDAETMKAGIAERFAALATPVTPAPSEQEPSAAEMAAFGASDAACCLYPGDTQQPERAAFCAGAAHAVSALPSEQEMRLREALTAYQRFAGETAGACLGLAMSTDHPAPDEALMEIFRKSQTLAAETRAALAQPATPSEDRWRHVKRGGVYTVVGRAELQTVSGALVDGSELVIYRGEDGKLWAREEGEFTDGRFVKIPTAPTGEAL